MMGRIFFVALFLSASLAWGKEVCFYENEDGVGDNPWCFHDDFPFDNMPLPDHPCTITPSFTLFTRTTPPEGVPLVDWGDCRNQMIVRLASAEEYDPSKKTMWMTHGYLQNGNTGWLHDMKDGVLEWEDVNVIVVGWVYGSLELWYPQAASSTQVVGAAIAEVANVALSLGASYKNLWCIGHSLGSHLCGHAGRRTTLGRVTGLDPAGPWFEGRGTVENGLGPDSAEFVDAWHTHGSANIVINTGTLEPRGHVDFYPNGGGDQPNCIIDPYKTKMMKRTREQIIGNDINRFWDFDWTLVCSHMRVLYLFMESLLPDCNFNAYLQCYDPYNTPGACWDCGEVCQVMGPEAINYPHGLFYMDTTGNSPYCKG